VGGIIMEEHLYCQGCGVQIQSEQPKEIGYIPESALSQETVLCQRCFRLKHYNETQDVSMSDDDFLRMVSDIRNTKGLVVHMIDIFDVHGSLLTNLSRIVGEKPIILVGNKLDLLPKSTNLRKLSQWLRSMARGIGVKVKDVCLVSSKKGHGIQELATTIDQYRNSQDVYVVGTTNVGKSTFINRLIDESTGEKNVITTSYFPGTTLGFIEIPLDDDTHLIDTPGIVNQRQMIHYLSKKDLKIITPTKEIKPRGYQLNQQQTLFIGGLARMDFIKGDRETFVCYFANDLPIHRTKTDHADDLYDRQVGELLTPPNKTTMKKLPPLTEHTFRIEEGQMDVVFPGLGWMTLVGGDVTITVYSPKDVAVSIRKSFIKKG